MTVKQTLTAAALVLSLLGAPAAHAQSYDDFSTFSEEPEDLDAEVQKIFGRFFQTSFLLGTGIFTGDLGAANAAGFMLGMKFIFYFDKVWALEMGGGYARHNAAYTEINTKTPGIDIAFSTHLIPFSLGFRYGFDQDSLPQGFSTMNPYLSANAVMLFRSEKLSGEPVTDGLTGAATKYADNDIINDNAFGFNVGGGAEFDVYKGKLLVGLDVRMNVIFWNDSLVKVGTILERNGSYLTIAGTMTYNY